jgi:BT1 family
MCGDLRDSAASTEAIAFHPTALSRSTRRRVFFYLAVLTILVFLGDPNEGLIDTPLSFFLKNRLHLQPHALANFRLVSAIPLYLSFVFGFVRDTWDPLGMRDRGFIVIFSAISAALYIYFAFAPVSYSTLLIAVFMLTCSFLFIDSAYSGLSSTLGQQHVMSGQISALWNIFGSLPTILAYQPPRK